MRTSQINKLESILAEKEKLLTDTISKADIHTELLVKGVLQIKHDSQ